MSVRFRRDGLVKRYMHGECMVMAATLSRMYDAPMIGVHDQVWTNVPRHVAVDMGHGRFADARGLEMSRESFLSPYAESQDVEIRPIEMAEIRRIWGRRTSCWQVPQSHLVVLGLVQRSLAA